MIELFNDYLSEDGKSPNTIKSYSESISIFLSWFHERKGMDFQKLHRENVREFLTFLRAGRELMPKTINTRINALVKFNEFLIEAGFQNDMVLTKKDYIKVQQQFASLAKVELKDVEKFRQLILESGNKRNFALVTLLAYAGLRISEALNLKMKDFNLVSREIIVYSGKGDKTRTVFMNDKVRDSFRSWIREREKQGIDSEFLFVSNRNKRLNRTTINKLFNTYSAEVMVHITPHDLRHFFCSHAIAMGMSVHEVANQAGHSNIHTTLLYTNPSKKELIHKMNLL